MSASTAKPVDVLPQANRATLAAYDAKAADFIDEWLSQPPASDLIEDLQRWLVPHGKTADIGCGSGREVDWLVRNAFPAIGYDASNGLLQEARRRFPERDFRAAALPELDGIANDSFDNVICETVIMHLPRSLAGEAIAALLRILRVDGVLYLSWRVTEGEDQVDARGRFYSTLTTEDVSAALREADVLEMQDRISRSSGKRIGVAVARKRKIIV